MLTVHKYPLQPGHQAVLMPQDAKVLSVVSQAQDGVVLYALVDTERTMISHEFYVTGTGHEIELGGNSLLGAFVGTVVMKEQYGAPGNLLALYLHVFEVTS